MLRRIRVAVANGAVTLLGCGFLFVLSLSAQKPTAATNPPGMRMQVSSYEFVPIEVPGRSNVSMQDVNNHRIAIGFNVDDTGHYHSFIWFKGQAVPVDHPGADYTVMTSITDSGIVFGTWGTSADGSPFPTVQHAAAYDLHSGDWMELPDVPGRPTNIGVRMNEAGVAVGFACDAGNNCQAWTWDGSQYTFFSGPGATGMGTTGMGINGRRVNVGYWEHDQITGAYFRYRDEFTPIELPWNPSFSLAQDINDPGQILLTAFYRPNDQFPTAFLWDRGSVIEAPKYPISGSQVSLYIGLNDHGDLAGFWVDGSFMSHGLMAVRK